MAMLAEPRRKQKVINLRAKNNAWSNDNTKFGQRMLEKMGWSAGKGLGAKENGIVEHVVARYKNDEKGLGFEDRNDQWTKHEDDFNSLLANLSNADSSTETLTSGISLEKKSKKSKARIHYHKFTRGKDLSRYSEKDLANIFGKKSFKEPEVKESIKENTVIISEQVFTEKGNMDDYFKSKLATFKSKSLNTDSNSRDNEESDYAFQGFSNSNTTEPEINQNGFGYQPFSFYSSENKNSSPNIESSCPEIETKSKKKKKSKQKELNLPELIQETTPEIMMDVVSIKVKKSKKKKKIECTEGTLLLERVDESNSTENLQNAAQNVLKDVKSTKEKKSKKQKYKELKDKTQSTTEIREDNSECNQDIDQDVESLKKKTKKKKFQECVDNQNQAFDDIVKKKNKNKKSMEQTQEQILVEDNIPKKKKKRKNQDF